MVISNYADISIWAFSDENGSNISSVSTAYGFEDKGMVNPNFSLSEITK